MNHCSVLIVGAGPAGLAVAGRLRRRGINFEIFEKGSQPGEAWHNHYDRLHLHTVRELSHLPGAPFPDSWPRYIPRAQLAQYYVEYAAERGITPRFGEAVTSIDRRGENWVARTDLGNELESEYVVVATGVNRVPNRPTYPGEDTFGGVLLHSSEYANPKPFLGKSVLVVGMGNTGAEIALDLCEQEVSTALSVRGPVNAVPRDVLGRPTHLTARTLGKLPPWLGGPIGSLLRKLTIGDLTKYGIPTPAIAPIQQLKVYGKTPVVDIGTVRRIKRGEIRVYPAIERLDGRGVHFVDGRYIAVDAVVLATGYRAQIEDFLGECDDLLDSNHVPGDVVGQGRYAGLFFSGFDNYQPGGVLGTIYQESEIIADAISNAESAHEATS